MTITTSPLTRRPRLLVAALIPVALTLALAGTGASHAQDRGTAPTPSVPATAAAPTGGYVATPFFTKQWNKAKAAFKRCKVKSAWKRYAPLRERGFRLADPVKRTKFYAGIVTTAYEAGRKATAKRYANRWRTWALSLGDYAPSSVVSSREAAAIMDVHLGKYGLRCT